MNQARFFNVFMHIKGFYYALRNVPSRFVRLEIYPCARRKTVIYHGLARIQVRVKHRGIILGAVAHYTAAVLMSNRRASYTDDFRNDR